MNRFANFSAALSLRRLNTTSCSLDQESNDIRRDKKFGEYRGFDYEEVFGLQVSRQTREEHVHLISADVSIM